MRNTIFRALIACFFLVSVAEGSWKPKSLEITTHWKDKYLLTNGGLAYDDDIFESVLKSRFDNGFGVGLWNFFSPDGDCNQDYGDELDYGAFYGFDLNGWERPSPATSTANCRSTTTMRRSMVTAPSARTAAGSGTSTSVSADTDKPDNDLGHNKPPAHGSHHHS